MKSLRVLVVDDERDMLSVCRSILSAEELPGTRAEIVTEFDARRAAERLAAEEFDLLFVDLKMPGMDGLDLVRIAREQDSSRVVVLLTGYPTIESAIQATKLGAFDYVTKPFTADQLRLVYRRAAEHHGLTEENRFLQHRLSDREGTEPFVGESQAVRDLLQAAERFAGLDSGILIVGPTGTGKTLLAKHIHRHSPRRNAPFVHVDCGALPEALLESELFGHGKGAFTGAVAPRRGLLEFAGSGSFFLDDICVLPLPLQAKLLGVLQERWFRRVGGNQVIDVNARFIAASNRNPEQEVRAGRFREDLFFRLNVLRLEVPALRERPADIPILARAFLERFGKPRGVKTLSEQVQIALERYEWPGNVRELRNVIERACVLASGDEVALEHLPQVISTLLEGGEDPGGDFAVSRENVLKQFESDYFRNLMERCGQNISEAAQRSGLSRNTIYRYLRKHGIRSTP